ncbi:MAG: ABC transporter permease [Clostridia bacterium]|nr:ABC transporter permease [Deltaproteobacteria bacterium]
MTAMTDFSATTVNRMPYDLATIGTLWRRDLMRFLRQPSRVVGALGQPIIFWFVIGSGMAASFRIPGSDVGYLSFFYPGVVTMVLLFASIFSTVSVIEDRHQGFLQAVMAGPGSRAALVLGKCFGSASVALLQVALFLLLAPAAGFSVFAINWPLLLAMLVITSLGLTALGVAMAWLLDNLQAFHAIQMTLLVPAWIVSGAMFPPSQSGAFSVVMRLNPLAYAVSGIRHALYGGAAPGMTTVSSSPLVDLLVVGTFMVLSVAAAVTVCSRRS